MMVDHIARVPNDVPGPSRLIRMSLAGQKLRPGKRRVVSGPPQTADVAMA